MKRFFFLPIFISYLLLTLFLIILFKYSIIYKVIIGIACLIIGFLSRRAAIPFRDTIKNDGEIFLSPIHGTVQSIRSSADGGNEIRISMGMLDEKGLYLPTTGEVDFLKAYLGKKLPRDAKPEDFYRSTEEFSHTDFTLTSKNQTKTLMRFIDCTFGMRPTIWLKSGDRGRAAACFGYYPFGGTLIIYLPKNSDILVFENEKIVPGQTVVAALKDIK